MRLHALLYHDVLQDGHADASGLAGPGAAVYKLDATLFARHLDAIQRSVPSPPVRINGSHEGPPAPGWLLTFDDGGSSALHPTADLLDQRGWTGHFFITAGRIGTRGFLGPDEIKELRRRGHVIGSHSWSHPTRFSNLSRHRMDDEWRRSTACLAEILGEPVCIASVPGGYYRPAVALTAADAGIRTLFTSEPVSTPARVHGCHVLGRFSIRRQTPPSRAAGLAAGLTAPRTAQWLAWNARKAVKRLGGDLYVSAREALLARTVAR